jgi:hypothetical protein
MSRELSEKYKERLQGIEETKEFLKMDVYLQAKIEAHLELLCELGLLKILEGPSKSKK